MEKTSNLELNKPEKGFLDWDEPYNENWDKLDAAITPLQGTNVKPGMIVAYGSATIPEGWLKCDGSAISRTDYKALYDIIGITFGVGDGSTTFNIPDLSEKYIQGSSEEASVGTVLEAGLPNITGQTQGQDGYLRDPKASGAFTTTTCPGSTRSGDGGWSAAYSAFDASKSNEIYGKSETVTPPTLVLTYIIKY